MIRACEIDEYRKCDLSSCRGMARWEFTAADGDGKKRRVFVCREHQLEGFARVKELA